MIRKISYVVLLSLFSFGLNAKTHLDGMSIYLLGTFSLSFDGTVSNLSLASSKYPAIDRQLHQKISTWKFEPVVVDEKIIDAKVEIDVLLDVALDDNGKETSMRIASVRFKLLNGPKYEKTNHLSYGFHNIDYPIAVFKIAEADVLVAMSTKPDGSVNQIGIKNIRLFPAGRLGLSEAQVSNSIKQLAESVESQRAFIGAKSKIPNKEAIKCETACLVMIHYNFPNKNRFRQWRGYQNTELPKLEWLVEDDSLKQSSNQNSDPYIKLVDPKQAFVNL